MDRALAGGRHAPAAVTRTDSIPLQLQVGNVHDVAHEEGHPEAILDPEFRHCRDELFECDLQLAPREVPAEAGVNATAQ